MQLSGRAHKDSDYTAMITRVYRCLHAEMQPGGEVVSAVIVFVSLILTTIAHSIRRAWLSHVMCINWNLRCGLAAYFIQAAFE